MDLIVQSALPPTRQELSEVRRHVERSVGLQIQMLLTLMRYERELSEGLVTPEAAWRGFQADCDRLRTESCEDWVITRSDFQALARELVRPEDQATLNQWIEDRDRVEDDLQDHMENIEDLQDKLRRAKTEKEIAELKALLEQERRKSEALKNELRRYKLFAEIPRTMILFLAQIVLPTASLLAGTGTFWGKMIGFVNTFIKSTFL